MTYLTLLFCLLGQLAFAGKPSKSTPHTSANWEIDYFGQGYHYTPFSADTVGAVARYDFHQYDTGSAYYMAGCLGTIRQTNVLGDIRGKTITLTAHLETTGTPNFVFGGEVTGWNTGGTPPHFRLFISKTKDVFNISTSQNDESHYWWSWDAWVSYDAMLAGGTILTYTNGVAVLGMTNGLVTVRLPVSAGLWSGPNGKLSTDPSVSAGFLDTLANVGAAQLFNGGGNFYDVGVGTLGPGGATFILDTFTVSP
jgi:hypothetical protein